MISITRDGFPNWGPHRYEDGMYVVATQITSDPIHHQSNESRVEILDEIATLLRTGRYKLRMSLAESAEEPSLINYKSILIDGKGIGVR